MSDEKDFTVTVEDASKPKVMTRETARPQAAGQDDTEGRND